MKRLFIVLIFISSFYAQAQDEKLRSWIVKIDAPLLIDGSSFPTLQLSVEKNINSRFSIIPEFGIQLYSPGKHSDTIVFKNRGFKANIEARLYLNRSAEVNTTGRKMNFFCGLQAFYRTNQSSESASYYKDEMHTEIIDDYGVKKKAYGLNVTFGYQKAFKNPKFIFEPHLGIGIIKKDVTNFGREFRRDENFTDDLWNSVRFFNLAESSGIRFNLNIGFRLGYKF